ncbi:MAG: hypothetical protein ACRDID_06410, partial [Ktedonobacterales bacterium]
AAIMLRESAAVVDPPAARRAKIAALNGESLDNVRSALDEAVMAYREAIIGLETLGENILLASAWRNLGETRHYRWLLDGQQRDHDECALCLNRALLIETQISERQGHSGRRLVLVYESLAKLAWDEGHGASARKYYVRMRQELDNNSQATSTDRAGQRLRERVTQALALLSASGFPEAPTEVTPDDAAPLGALATSGADVEERLREEPSAAQQMAWARIKEQLDQVIIRDLHELIRGGLREMSDISSQWAETLYELEQQEGPRLMAQQGLSSILFMKALKSISERTSAGRQKRRKKLEENILTAKVAELGVCYDDICSARQVSVSLRAPLGEPETRHFERALALLRNADEAYRLTPIPFELPFGFAIKDHLLLLEIPKALASAELGVNLDEPGEFACFRIERNWRLQEQMKGIFAQLRAIGQANELSGSMAADWLERLRASGLADQQPTL